jgi:hypothetical protein
MSDQSWYLLFIATCYEELCTLCGYRHQKH